MLSEYSGDLNTWLVWNWNGRKLLDGWMVQYLNVIWIPDRYFSDVSYSDLYCTCVILNGVWKLDAKRSGFPFAIWNSNIPILSTWLVRHSDTDCILLIFWYLTLQKVFNWLLKRQYLTNILLRSIFNPVYF